MKHEITELREQFTTLLTSQTRLEEEFEALETTAEQKKGELGEEMSVKMTELNRDIHALTLRVDFMQQDGDEDELVDKATDRVMDDLMTRLAGD